MICRALLAVAAWLTAAGGPPAAAMDCPNVDYDRVETLLTEAPSCDWSMKLLLACQRGASGDVGSAMIVIRKCEGNFLASLSKRRRRAYGRQIGACWHRFTSESGSLFVSIRAICAAQVAHDYAARAAKHGGR